MFIMLLANNFLELRRFFILYYNPYSLELKDERLELVRKEQSEEQRGNTKYLLYKLHEYRFSLHITNNKYYYQNK